MHIKIKEIKNCGYCVAKIHHKKLDENMNLVIENDNIQKCIPTKGVRLCDWPILYTQIFISNFPGIGKLYLYM